MGECGSKQLSLFSCLSVQHVFLFYLSCWLLCGFFRYQKNVSNPFMDSWYIFLHYSRPLVSSDCHQFGVLLCETVWNIWSFQTHVSLRLHDVTRRVFFSSLFSPQGHWAFIIENKKLFFSCLHGYNNWFERWIWHLCGVSLHISWISQSIPHPLSFYSDQLYSTGGFELSG